MSSSKYSNERWEQARMRLFLRFFENLVRAGDGVEFLVFQLALHLLTVLPREIGEGRLGRLEFYEVILRHKENLPESGIFRKKSGKMGRKT